MTSGGGGGDGGSGGGGGGKGVSAIDVEESPPAKGAHGGAEAFRGMR